MPEQENPWEKYIAQQPQPGETVAPDRPPTPEVDVWEKYATAAGPEDQGVFSSDHPIGAAFEILAQLQRPQSAMFKYLEEGLEGKDFISAVKSGFEELIEFDERVTFEDVLNAGGVPEFPYRGVLEFAGDVVLDPLWFAPPVAKAGLKIAGKAGYGGVKKLESVATLGIGNRTKKIADAIERNFTGGVTKPGKYARASITQTEREAREAIRWQGVISKRREEMALQVAEKFGIHHDEALKAITGATESIIPPSQWPHDLARAADDFISNDLMSQADLSVGRIKIDRLREKVLDKEATEFAQGMVDELGGVFTLKPQEVVSLRDEVKQLVSNAGYDPRKAAPNLTDEAWQMVEAEAGDLGNSLDNMLGRERAAGVTRSTAMESDRLDYITHAIHPDAKKILMSHPNWADDTVEKGLIWNTRHASQIQRRIKNLSVNEANRLTMKGKSPIAELAGKNVPLFIDNPSVLEAIRGVRSIRVTAAAKMMDDMVTRFGKKTKDLSRAEVGSGEWGKVKIDGFQEWSIPAEASRQVNKYWTAATDSKVQSKFAETYFTAQNSWKAWTLGVFPEYHFRNAVTNVWNNFLAGMGPESAGIYTKAASVLSAETKSRFIPAKVKALTGEIPEIPKKGGMQLDDVITLKRPTTNKVGWKGTVRELLNAASDNGVRRGGIFAAEMFPEARDLSALSKGVGYAGRVARGTAGPVPQGFKVGGMVEDHARLSHFMWRLSWGDDAATAAKSVSKSLFDYDNLDPLFQSARNVAPFIAWTRFNVPYQLEHLITDPAKASLINKVRRHVEDEAGTNQKLDERYIAEYMRTGMAIRTRRTDSGYQVFLLDNWVPLADLSEMGLPELRDGADAFIKKAGPWAANLLSPLITLPAESVFNESIFLGREFLPEKRKFLGVNFSEKQTNALRAVRLLSVIDRFVPGGRKDTLGENIIRTITGLKARDMNMDYGRRGFYAEMDREIKALRGGQRRARRKKNDSEVERLEKEIQKLLVLRRTPQYRRQDATP